ncbi:MAG TPA: CHAT domain-containing protein, partial [Acidimicrobiales bacterium]|nr:CHAT domain-containing protein [Acidimicrobiales bacterium]
EDGKDNGLLQAWEIFERLRVDADLVVLSACRSGLGSEMGGEGLIGLTRAFQYAGARSVVASLWEVSDPATADLMVRFYRRLRRGHPVDEALRAAQLDLIRSHPSRHGETGGVDPASPFVWAAFQLFGDGR